MFMKTFLLLALGVQALSLPGTDEALEKRSSHAWIGSFDSDDTTCSNSSMFQDSSALSDAACVPFRLQGGRVGGRWGSGKHEINVIQAFVDTGCQEAQVNITRIGAEKGFCVDSSMWDCEGGLDVGNPCFWNSVKGSRIRLGGV